MDQSNAVREAVLKERAACKRIAESYANTKPNLVASDDQVMARVIATVMSDTGRKIADAIDARE